MSAPWKSKKPVSLTKKAIHAALQAQRPLDQDAASLVRKKSVRRDWDEGVADIGANDKTAQKVFDDTYAKHADEWMEVFGKKP